MAIEPFKTPDEFLGAFDLTDSPYTDFKPYTDAIAFSLKRNYPKNIRYKPAKTRSGEDNNVAIIHVLYIPPKEMNKIFNPERVPIEIEICNFNFYLRNRFRYNFEDEDCPTRESLEQMATSTKPINLGDKYFYNHARKTFISLKGNEMSGRQIIDKIFVEHCNTVHLIKGIKIRTKVKLQEIGLKICDWLINGSKYILKVVLGYRLIKIHSSVLSLTGYKKKDLELVDDKTINVIGYKAPKRIVITFSFLFIVLILVFILINFDFIKQPGLSNIFGITLITMFLVYLILWFLEEVVPKVFILLINLLMKLRVKIVFLFMKF